MFGYVPVTDGLAFARAVPQRIRRKNCRRVEGLQDRCGVESVHVPEVFGICRFLAVLKAFRVLAFAGFVGLSDMFFSDVFILPFWRSAFCWVWFDGKGSLIRQKGAVALRAFCGRWKG